MKSISTEALNESIELRQLCLNDEQLLSQIEKLISLAKGCINRGGTIYTMGNGGSACDAMHLREELVGRFKRERPGIRAQHLMDPATMSCWANDYDYNEVFAREVSTLCTPKDLIIAFSTSGNSANILAALQAAQKCETQSACLLGKDGGKAKDNCTLSIIIPSDSTERIQEMHITLVHILCEALEA